MGAGVGFAVAACIEVRPFRGDAGSDSATSCTPDFSVNGPATLTWTADGPGGTVTGPSYVVHFANDPSKFHFPDIVQIGGINFVGEDSRNECNNEEEVGMALFPAAAIHANGSATVGTNELSVVPGWIGPAVTKVLVRWSTVYTCGSITRTPGGFSQFTLFPDGRIYRHDRMSDDVSTTTSWGTCGCVTSGAAYVPTSFWSFLRAPFTTYYDADGTDHLIADIFLTVGVQTMPGAATCLQGASAQTIAAGWPDGIARLRLPANETLAMVRDFDRTADPTMVHAFSYASPSVIVLGNGPTCTAANGGLARATAAIRRNEALFVNSQVELPSVVDGIYGGPDAPDGPAGVAIDAGSGATLTGTLSAGFAVWLKLSSPACDITVTKLPEPSGPYFTKQKVDEDEWGVWFRDELVSGQTIAINAK